MAEREVYLDEAGYTGGNLLDPQQPVYALAAVSLSKEAAQDLVAQCFPRVKLRELGHTSLVRHARGQQQLVDFIHALAKHPDSASVDVAHKEYVLLGLLVDFWIESAMHRDGYNLYEGGANIALVNATYLTLGALLGNDGRREFLRRFQVMVRDRTDFAYESFWDTVRDLCKRHPEFDEKLFGLYVTANERLGRGHLWTLPKHLLDLGEYGLLKTVNHWREKTDDPLRLLHDANTALARNAEAWNVWLSADAPPAIVGQDRRITRYPLCASIELVDSVSHVQLQLADLVAGATAALMGAKVSQDPKHPQYVEALKKSPLLKHCLIGGVWPSASVTPQDLETEGPVHGDAAEYMAALLKRSRQRTE
jgi:Protein of unknown function (DUF3800)